MKAEEIITAVQRNIDRQDEYILATCAHAIGHLARRFTVDVSEPLHIKQIRQLMLLISQR